MSRWGRDARQTFAEQFEQNGTGYIYRRSQKGQAIPVSATERDRFIEDYRRDTRRGTLMTVLGLAIALGTFVAISAYRETDLLQIGIYAAVGAGMIASISYTIWAWGAPARVLAGRTPVAGARSPDEVRRFVLHRISYGQLAAAAFAGIMLPLWGLSRYDLFTGWKQLIWVPSSAMVLLAGVQAFRKWRLDQDNPYALTGVPVPQQTPQPPEPSTSRGRSQFVASAIAVAVLGAFAFVIFTPAGRKLAQTPSFWPIVMIGMAGWAFFTVAKAFTKGQIEPMVRGVHNTYHRDVEPKRFWASVAWNSILGCIFIWAGVFNANGLTRQPTLQDRCYDENSTPEEAVRACTELIAASPRDSHAYLDRGLAYLNSSKLDQAVTDFTRAHELDQRSPWPLANRGIAYASKNDRTRAERDFEAVKAIDPENPVVLHGEAILSMNAGDLEVAIDRLTTALKRNPKDSWSLQTRADAYQQAGDFAKARADRAQLQQMMAGAKARAS